MTQEAHKLIIVWQLSYWSNAKPERKEYSKETAHFYVRADGRRDAKTSRYYQFFATQEAAQAACDNRAAAKQEAAERERRQIGCVNALAGIPIEAIESGVVAELATKAAALLDATERHVFGDECAKERDEMRAAIALIRERVVLKEGV